MNDYVGIYYLIKKNCGIDFVDHVTEQNRQGYAICHALTFSRDGLPYIRINKSGKCLYQKC